jgi:hypothetical protein
MNPAAWASVSSLYDTLAYIETSDVQIQTLKVLENIHAYHNQRNGLCKYLRSVIRCGCWLYLGGTDSPKDDVSMAKRRTTPAPRIILFT